MATIALYANKINSMPGLVKDIRNSVNDLKSEFMTLKSKSQSINRNICNLDDVISSISTSTQTQEDKMDALNNLAENIKEFASDVERIDNNVATMINKSKNDFYDKYDYLKPENIFEMIWESCKSGLETAAEWCKEHWKLVVTVVLVVAAVVVLVVLAGVGGPIAAVLVMAAKGLLIGAATGGLIGGGINLISGKSFWEGFEDGAFGGAIAGAISGGLSAGMTGGSSFAQALANSNPAGLLKGAGLLERFKFSWIVTGKVIPLEGFWKIISCDVIADIGTSLLGDIGDIYIKGENISGAKIISNILVSAILSGSSSGISQKISVKKIPGINIGNGSWKHVWASQSTRSLRYGTHMRIKTYLKGIGVSALDHVGDFCLGTLKDLMDKWIKSCDLLPQH